MKARRVRILCIWPAPGAACARNRPASAHARATSPGRGNDRADAEATQGLASIFRGLIDDVQFGPDHAVLLRSAPVETAKQYRFRWLPCLQVARSSKPHKRL